MTVSLLTGAALTAILAAVVVSPLLFLVIARRTSRWPELADVGSAYGGVAAVLSGVALVGIALSLLFQWRQTVSSQMLSVRQRHFELVKLSLDEPKLLGPDHDPDKDALRRLHANLWIAHWAMLWDLRQCDEGYLRQVATELFADEDVRAWWRASGQTWSAKPTRRRQRFNEILTSECLRLADAAAAAPTTPKSLKRKRSGATPLNKRDTPEFASGLAIGLFLGLAAASWLGTLHRSRRAQASRRDS